MEKPHIAVVPSPGFTHLVPILEFSKRLLHLHPEFHITCFIPSVGSPPTSSKSYLQTLPPTISSIFLPPITLDHVPDATVLAVQIELSVNLSLPYIRQELKSLCSRAKVVALVVDVFAHGALDFGRELNLLSYIYLPQSAMLLSLYFNSSKLDETLRKSRNPQEPIKIPGCVPILSKDLPLPFQNLSSVGYKGFLERARKLHAPDGIFMNTFLELESRAIRALQEHIKGKPKVYPVGPIIQIGSIGHEHGLDLECLTWLDKQEPKSVLYVSFGSGGTLSQDQLNELAFGLELSGQKFLWVVRAPSSVVSSAYFGAEIKDPLQFLPQGFLERTKKQGLVVPSWAPQIQVLGHSATGGFLSHCGWNSVVESVVKGVPVIAWPLFAEQSLNAAMLSDDLKVALRPKVNENGLAEREEIAKVVRGLMEDKEGMEIRKRMEALKIAAANAIKEDGSSTKTLSEYLKEIKYILKTH
ncbi:UDP-glycosyltransferase 72B1, partial [Mucuna pruriens]